MTPPVKNGTFRPLPDSYRKPASLFGVATAVLGLLGLFGWILGMPLLSSIRSSYIPMAPLTSVAFLCLGGLLLHHSTGPSQRRVGILAAVLSALLSAYGLIELVEGLGMPVLSLEEWLFPYPPMVGAIPAGRMSPATAALLLLSGAVVPILFLRERGKERQKLFGDLAGCLGILVAMAGAVIVLSYLHQTPFLYSTATIPMSATTAIAFLFLGTGQILAVGPDSFPSRLFAGSSARARLLRVFVSTTVGVVVAIDLLHVYAHRIFFDDTAFISGVSTTAFLVIAGTLIARVALKVGDDMDRSEEFRRRAEDKLRESEDRFRDLVEHSQDLICTHDLEGRILTTNPWAATVLGYAPDEVLRMNFRDLLVPEVRHEFGRYLEEIRTHGTAQGLMWIQTRNGERRFWEYRNTLRTEGVAEPIVRGMAHDITEQKRAEETLQEQFLFLQVILDAIPAPVFYKDARGFFLGCNKAYEEYIGHPKDLLVGKTVYDIAPKDLADTYRGADDALFRKGGSQVYETKMVPADGKRHDVIFSKVTFSNPDGSAGGLVGTILDITERKRAEEEIKVLAKFPSENPDPIMRISADGTLLYINESGSGQLSEWNLQVGQIAPPLLRDAVSRALNDGSRKMLDLEYGESAYSFSVSPVRDAGYANLYGRNTTERKNWERSLKESEEQLRVIFEGSKDGILLVDVESKKFYTGNKTICDMLQYSLDEIRQLGIRDIHPEEDLPWILERFNRQARQENEMEKDIPVKRKDSSVLFVDIKASPITVSGRSYLMGNFRDATERRKAEEAVTRLGLAVDQAADVIVITNTEGTIQYVNPAFERSTGYSREEAVGKNPRVLRSGKQDKVFYRRLWDTLTRGEVWTGHFINRKKDGSLYEEDATISPLRDSSGKIVNYVATKRDVTNVVSLERQVRMAQRMESVGTLAGGIAHDFNNALTVIIGFGEMLKLRIANDPKATSDLDEVLRSAERASVLTRQLLTFARRQIVELGNLDLNRVVTDLEKLLRNVTRADIQIRTLLAEELPTIRADQGQVEQVLMNLSLNARDAMPGGGQLVVETQEAWVDEEYVKQYPYMKAGRYAVLSVSDTGIGMDEGTRERIFEPFFTTKGPDKGTGLGLAMVYGIVKQHNGFIHVYSEPGKGTTFRIYFPAVDVPPDSKIVAAQGILRGGSETILLAEDNESVRHLTERTLISYGYRVLIACDGEEAVDIFRRHGKEIAMVVLDMVMPKMGGKPAYDEMTKILPGFKVLFLSGYSANAIHDSFVLHPGIPFLQKPFGPGTLARKVREVLDGK